MLTEVNSAARFLPKREFRASLATSVSAPVAAGCNRLGGGQSFKVLCSVLVAVVLGAAGAAGPAVLAEHEVSVDDRADISYVERHGKGQHRRTLISKPEQYAIMNEREVRRKV
jgi:hypothetical protein